MPRKYSLPEREAAVCRRLLSIRESLRISRSVFAQSAGLPSKSYANYEGKMAAVPYYAGKAVCRAFDVNQRWLATGQSPRHPYVDLDTELKAGVPFKALFTEGFEDYLQKPMLEWLRLFASAISVRPEDLTDDDAVWLRVGGQVKDAADVFERVIGIGVSGMIHYIPDRLRLPFVRAMCATIEKFKEEHTAEIDAWWEEFNREFEAEGKTGVDKRQICTDNPDVRLTWNDLKKRLVRATADSGKKAEAAKFVGVHQSNLTRWLNTDREPGAGATFRLLEWVTAEEAKQQSSQGAQTPGEPVTPKGISNEEDYSSRPGKPSPGKIAKAIPPKRKPR